MTDSVAIMGEYEIAPARRQSPGAWPTGGNPMDNAEPTPRQRGPYAGRDAQLSYEERLELRSVPRPCCKCGCGTLTRWLSSKTRWAVYARGHRSNYDAAWLCEQYVEKRRTAQEIADDLGVDRSTVRRRLVRNGVVLRDRSESMNGRARTVVNSVSGGATRSMSTTLTETN
jgi:DNA-directed RNA polymerase subunit N (RpoN/RPB10)